MERLPETIAPIGVSPPAGGPENPAEVAAGPSRRRSESMERQGLPGTIPPIGAGPPTRGTGSPSQVAVGAYGGRAGDCSSQTARANRWANRLEGTGSPAHAAVRAYGGPAGDGRSQTASSHQQGGRGVLPMRRSVPTELLRGTVAPIGACPPTGGTGSPSQAAVNVYGGPAGDGSSQWPGPTI